MPVQTLGTSYRYFTSSQLTVYVTNHTGNTYKDVGAAIASLGVTSVAGFMATGVLGVVFGLSVGGILGAQAIKDTYDSATMNAKFKAVAKAMDSRENRGLSAGKARVTVAKRQWVSSNGNSYSGVYEVPINAIHVV